jgi:hypothetical protein
MASQSTSQAGSPASSSSSSSSSGLSAFHEFPRLVIELKQLIVGAASPGPRSLYIRPLLNTIPSETEPPRADLPEKYWQADIGVIPLMGATKEIRDIGLKRFTVVKNLGLQNSMYFDYNADVLSFETLREWETYLKDQHRDNSWVKASCDENIKRVSVDLLEPKFIRYLSDNGLYPAQVRIITS